MLMWFLLSFVLFVLFCFLLFAIRRRLRSHFKNSCFVFHRGFQTLENNKSTRPTASCFHQFSRVWKPRWNTRTRFWNITWKRPRYHYFSTLHRNRLSSWVSLFALKNPLRFFVGVTLPEGRNDVMLESEAMRTCHFQVPFASEEE